MVPILCIGVFASAVGVVMGGKSGTVYPFAPTTPDPVSDTLAGPSDTDTVFVDDGWSAVMLTSLREVEDLLDTLEVHAVTQREVCALGNSLFRVRWR